LPGTAEQALQERIRAGWHIVLKVSYDRKDQHFDSKANAFPTSTSTRYLLP